MKNTGYNEPGLMSTPKEARRIYRSIIAVVIQTKSYCYILDTPFCLTLTVRSVFVLRWIVESRLLPTIEISNRSVTLVAST